MQILNTRPYDEEILKYNTLPDAKVKSARKYRPIFEAPLAEHNRVPEAYQRNEIALMLQGELERRFIVLCEVLYYDKLCSTYPDAILITEAVARFKEAFYIMEKLNVPPNFIYNTPDAYCKFFQIGERLINLAITKNGEYLTERDAVPSADGTTLRAFLKELNNSNIND